MTIATGQQALASDVLELLLKSKVISATRDLTAAAGDVAYTGVGFQPSVIVGLFCITGDIDFGVGISDSALLEHSISQTYAGDMTAEALLFYIAPGVGVDARAIVASYDANGFTLTWTKTGAPTGTAQLRFLCLK